MDDDDAIPVCGQHRGVWLEDQQSPERLALVKAEIDAVLGLTDAGALADWAGDSWHSPESRQLAAAMAESAWVVAAETRAVRPIGISIEKLHASVAGLDSVVWRDPWRYASLLDSAGGVLRDEPLPDDA